MSVYRPSHYWQEARNLNHLQKCPTCTLLCPPIKLILNCKCTTYKLKPFVSKYHPQINFIRIPQVGVKAQITRGQQSLSKSDSLGNRTQASAFFTSFPFSNHPKPKHRACSINSGFWLSPQISLIIQTEPLNFSFTEIQSCLGCQS